MSSGCLVILVTLRLRHHSNKQSLFSVSNRSKRQRPPDASQMRRRACEHIASFSSPLLLRHQPTPLQPIPLLQLLHTGNTIITTHTHLCNPGLTPADSSPMGESSKAKQRIGMHMETANWNEHGDIRYCYQHEDREAGDDAAHLSTKKKKKKAIST